MALQDPFQTTYEGSRKALGSFGEALMSVAKGIREREMEERKMKLLESAEERDLEKLEREALTSVAKGELDISWLPEALKKKVVKAPKISTEGMRPKAAEVFGKAQPSPAAQFMGPFFKGRVTPGEIPEEAQTRMREAYSTQQQAINPYKALQAMKLSQLKPIWEKYNRGETLTNDEKILIGTMAKEKDIDPFQAALTAKLVESMGIDINSFSGSVSPKKTETLEVGGIYENAAGERKKYKGNGQWGNP